MRRVSVADAFAAAGVSLPAQFLKSNTTNRDGTPCVRSVRGNGSARAASVAPACPTVPRARARQVQQPAFTITASHPLIWCDRAGVTLRCLHVSESALLMGFAPGWTLPLGSRVGLRAVGNAVPPPLSAAVMSAAVIAAGRPAPPPLPAPTPSHPPASRRRPLEEGATEAAEGAGEDSCTSDATVEVLAERVDALQHAVRRLRQRVGALEQG